jgi:hypothetical protein
MKKTTYIAKAVSDNSIIFKGKDVVSLERQIKNFLDNNEPYLIEVGLTSIDYEKYYKQGPFINDYGKPVHEDYWDYVEDVDVNRDIEDYWITFHVYRLIEN